MARKHTAVPESALMEAFEQGKLLAWESAYDAGYNSGYLNAQMEFDAWDCQSHYQHGRQDAADSFADWLDSLPTDVYAVLKPYIVNALAGVLTDRPPF